MSKYPRITLKEIPFDKEIDGETVNAPHNLLEDIKALKAHFGNSYWAITQEPQKKLISPAEFDQNGNVTKEAEYSAEFYSTVILPKGHDFDLGSLNTLQDDIAAKKIKV